VDRIGNLTLVTATYNRGVSNYSWDVKGPEIQGQKVLPLNDGIGETETWNEQAIEARGRALGTLLCRVWPSADVLQQGGA
jgi:hypothetical protein